MNLGSMRNMMIKSAKQKLAQHKNLGRRSSLSILEVAELLDIVSGNNLPNEVDTGLSLKSAFSLN